MQWLNSKWGGLILETWDVYNRIKIRGWERKWHQRKDVAMLGPIY
jgi:hypothetical protein